MFHRYGSDCSSKPAECLCRFKETINSHHGNRVKIHTGEEDGEGRKNGKRFQRSRGYSKTCITMIESMIARQFATYVLQGLTGLCFGERVRTHFDNADYI